MYSLALRTWLRRLRGEILNNDIVRSLHWYCREEATVYYRCKLSTLVVC